MKIQIVSLIAGAVLLLGTATAQAEGPVREVKGGVLAHDVSGLWSGFKRESGADANLEIILSPMGELWGGEVSPAFGLSVNAGSDTSKLYGAARWETDLGQDGFFAFGVGGAVHNGETKLVRSDKKALGSKALFYFPIELGYRFDEQRSVSLFFDHVSNAWLASPNEGMDTLGIRFGYRF